MSAINEVLHFDIADEILAARKLAHEKHGDSSMEVVALSDLRMLSILVEEVGEVAHEMTYDAVSGGAGLRDELVDVAVVAIAWIAALDKSKAVPL